MRRGGLLIALVAATVLAGPGISESLGVDLQLHGVVQQRRLEHAERLDMRHRTTADADGIPDSNDAVSIPTNKSVVISVADVTVQSLTLTSSQVQFMNNRALTVSGATTMNGGRLLGPGTLNANGGWTQQTTNMTILNNVTVNITANGTWSDGTLCMSGGLVQLTATLNVGAGADNLLDCAGGSPRFLISPAGSLVVAGGSRLVNTILEVDGLLNLAGGTLTMSGPAPAGNDGGTSRSAPPRQ